MEFVNSHSPRLIVSFSLLMTIAACAHRAPGPARPATSASASAPVAAEPQLEAKAIEILKAASNRLASARSLRFTAVVSYENPSTLGPPLVYMTKSAVTVRRPNKLRVNVLGDGPSSEFYYDGKQMTAFAPTENLVAVADAPDTIDGALQAAYDSAAIYYPFSDLIVADPYGDIAPDLKTAFYIGQSQVVGATTTDIVAYASNDVFVQIWVGTKDKLPRMMRAVFMHDPARLRHEMVLTDWQLDPTIPADAFDSSRTSHAKRIQFAHPNAKPPSDARRPGAPAKAQ